MCLLVLSFRFFFFKQKTAYELRISDWSSDVSSSDLTLHSSRRHVLRGTMAHFGMLGRAFGIGRKRHVMVYRCHVGSLLVGSTRLWRAMTHRGMLGRAARSLRLHVHARHTVMIHLLRRRFGRRLQIGRAHV